MLYTLIKVKNNAVLKRFLGCFYCLQIYCVVCGIMREYRMSKVNGTSEKVKTETPYTQENILEETIVLFCQLLEKASELYDIRLKKSMVRK